MPLKALTTTLILAATTLGLGGDTSIANTNLQIIIRRQLQEIINYLQDNSRILEERINGIGIAKVKLPLIKRFLRKKLKLKGFLI